MTAPAPQTSHCARRHQSRIDPSSAENSRKQGVARFWRPSCHPPPPRHPGRHACLDSQAKPRLMSDARRTEAMPERIKLTEKVLRDAEPVPGRDYQIFDTDVRGFAACIYRGGGRAFTLDYRHAGRQRRMTFGAGRNGRCRRRGSGPRKLRRESDAGADPWASARRSAKPRRDRPDRAILRRASAENFPPAARLTSGRRWPRWWNRSGAGSW